MPEPDGPLVLTEFPLTIVSAGWGRWWRVHSKDYGPWFYASDDSERDPESIGRFDLPKPHGTLYVGEYIPGTAPEAVREADVAAAESQAAYNARRLSALPLDAYHGLAVADFTSSSVARFGAPADIAALPRSEARPWARAAHEGQFHGILYRLREDPKRRRGLALFGDGGPADPPRGQQDPWELPTGLRNEMHTLFEGEYRGDPIPR
ncbi:MAG TPA: RES family NAD+ phosphorylase [Solirubrobacteraceae bacterium]|jgi:hypothetical protein